jgi:hypothetical protein
MLERTHKPVSAAVKSAEVRGGICRATRDAVALVDCFTASPRV